MSAPTLNNQDKYVIQGMLEDNYSIEDIGRTLGKSERAIKLYINKLDESKSKIQFNKDTEEEKQKVELLAAKTERKRKAKKERKAQTENATKITAGSLMKNRTDTKKERGVAVMTAGASELADENKKRLLSVDISNKIHKINKDRKD